MNIDELLVVTFTNAAASEMRQRMLDAIYAYLEEHPEDTKMQEQIVKMGKASICTIHAFCLEVIRNHFYEIGVSPNIRIGKPNEMELLKRQVLEELFEEKYETEDKEFLLLIDTYTTYQRDDALKDLVLNIFNTIKANPFPEEWLKKAVEDFNISKKEDFANTKWGKILLEEAKEEIETCVLDLKSIKKELEKYEELSKFTETIKQDITNLENIKTSTMDLVSWDKVLEQVTNTKWGTWPREKIESIQKDQAKEKRDQVKKKYNKVKDKFFIASSEQIRQDMVEMYRKLACLRDLIFEFETAFAKEKLEKNVMDFHDIEHFALKILVKTDENGEKRPSEVALSYKEKFKEIAIDEYQDSNLIQEYILNMISNGNNLFMVGDVKQSIYKFRQARPELFLEKYETYQTKDKRRPEEDLKIQLFKNFRSRENVLEVTNHVFESIMSKILGEIDYNKEEYLNLGANFPSLQEDVKEKQSKNEKTILPVQLEENEDVKLKKQYKTSLHILNLKEPEEKEDEELEQVENAVLEARFVANQIQELIKGKFQVYDKTKGYRDICYKDIVILLRSTASVAPIFEKELNNQNIPVFSDTGSGYFDSIEIQTMLSLLKIIDNPKQDIPFVSVLRSQIGKFDDNELIRIKLNGERGKKEDFYTIFRQALENENLGSELEQKMKEFLSKLEEFRNKNEYMPLDEFIWHIYMETGYYQYVGLMPNGQVKQANLKMLFERAREYEKASFKGLFYFIAYINQLRRASSDMDSAKIISENEDVVRIMSIHKSKGLEFPVVILSATSKKFNLMDLNAPILLHQDLGIGPKYIDEVRKIEYPTLQKLAISAKVTKETLSEEMRILYVALTRAKEKLIITGVRKDFEKEIAKKKERLALGETKEIPPNLVKQYKSYLDWLELVYLKDEEKAKTMIELEVHEKQELQKGMENSTPTKREVHFIEESKKYEKKKELQKQLEWQYPYESSCDIPTMTSVSKIKEIETKRDLPDLISMIEPNRIEFKKEKKVPEFLKEEVQISSARKGTLVHLCLQHINEKEEYTLAKIETLIKTLEQKQIITKKEAEAIPTKDLLDYTKSDLFNKLKQAKEIHKETPFYFDMQAKEIVGKEVEEPILVQGIIDLYYIDKEHHMILVDYKTDFVKKEEDLIIKYQKQLEIYKRALEEASGKKVDEVYIYSVYLQKEIMVP